MDKVNLLTLRNRILKARADYPALPFYVGPFGILKRLERLESNGQLDEKGQSLKKDLRLYIDLGGSIVSEMAEAEEKMEAAFVITYCADAFKDADFEGSERLLSKMLAFYGEGGMFLPREEIAANLAIILGYMRVPAYWRGKPYAKRLAELLKDNGGPYEAYCDLAAYYKMVLDYPSASSIALLGAEDLLRQNKKHEAALLAKEGLSSASLIPDFPFPSESEIHADYEEETEVVLGYKEEPTIKHDPIELTPEFQAVYDEVMEEALTKYNENKETHVFAFWESMREGFARRNILWRSPILMNPGMKID